MVRPDARASDEGAIPTEPTEAHRNPPTIHGMRVRPAIRLHCAHPGSGGFRAGRGVAALALSPRDAVTSWSGHVGVVTRCSRFGVHSTRVGAVLLSREASDADVEVRPPRFKLSPGPRLRIAHPRPVSARPPEEDRSSRPDGASRDSLLRESALDRNAVARGASANRWRLRQPRRRKPVIHRWHPAESHRPRQPLPRRHGG